LTEHSSPSMAAEHWVWAPSARIEGDLVIPGDKSVSHRALMLGSVAEGTSHIRGFLAGEDCLASLRVLRQLGVRILQHPAGEIEVHGVGLDGFVASQAPLDMGNAGTAMRLFMGLLSGRRFESVLVGDQSLMRRPMERVAAPLREMGAKITTAQGRPPVTIHAGERLQGIDYVMPVASAQVKSAILLAALRASGATVVTEPAPTRDHTERMLQGFGVQITRNGARVAVAGGQRLQGTRIDVPGDISSAAFFLVAGSIAREGELVLRNVGMNPTRDGILRILRAMGANITLINERHVAEPVADLLVRPARLQGIEVPLEWVPLAIDEFPAFFIAAACAQGRTRVRGAAELRVKESDRLAVMSDGLHKLGIEHALQDDGIDIEGGTGEGDIFEGGEIDSHGDHRIAMAFAVASLRAAAPIRILDVSNVATSFPSFSSLAIAAGLRHL
jgi:3-phosphoshikimate 1-carboxyvinyltransferase